MSTFKILAGMVGTFALACSGAGTVDEPMTDLGAMPMMDAQDGTRSQDAASTSVLETPAEASPDPNREMQDGSNTTDRPTPIMTGNDCGPSTCSACSQGCAENHRCQEGQWICECACGDGGNTLGDPNRGGPGMDIANVFITELMLSNEMTLFDEFGEADDWLELYNAGTVEVELTGWALGDAIADGGAPWPFAQGIVIRPDSYLIVWADNDDEQGPLHANFKLSAGGETVTLLDDAGQIIDEVTVPALDADTSYVRQGTTDDWMIASMPTPGLPNRQQVPAPIESDFEADTDMETEPIMDPEREMAAGIESTSETTPFIFITELMLSNEMTLIDEAGEADDWIEVYNAGAVEVDLEGWSLGDAVATNEAPWTFPANTMIDSGAFVLVWADNDEDQGPLHADFKLASNGETVTLLNPEGTIEDEILVPALGVDQSYAREGTSDVWNITNSPTPSSANQ